MRITKIEIRNFKAFHNQTAENYIFDLSKIDGDRHSNLLVYGENGSGKSSLYKALKAFFTAAVDDAYDISEDEFRFLDTTEKGSVEVKIEFKDMKNLKGATSNFRLNTKSNETKADYIEYIGHVMPFIDYKMLLKTHYDHTESTEVNIFDLFIKMVYYRPNDFNSPSTLGEDWDTLNDLMKQSNARNKESAFNELLPKFKQGLEAAIEDIQTELDEIIEMFGKKIKVTLEIGENPNIEGQPKSRKWNSDTSIVLKIDYNEEFIEEHHNFLNEARLTSIAIALYLSIIKKMPQGSAYKALFLDDILIGLDNSNRQPLLKILNSDKFKDYQLFLTTYDRHWFETAKNWFTTFPTNHWKCYEMYVDKDVHDFEIPKVFVSESNLAKASMYIQENDYGAAANYMRKACEELIDSKFPIKALKDKNGVTVEKLEQKLEYAAKFYEKIGKDFSIFDMLVCYKDSLMNPLSHNDTRPLINKNDLIEVEKTLKNLESIEDLKEMEYKTILTKGTKIELRIDKPSDDYFVKIVTNVYIFELKDALWHFRKEKTQPFSTSNCKLEGFQCYEMKSGAVNGGVHKLGDNYNSFADCYNSTIDHINLSDLPAGASPLIKLANYMDFFFIQSIPEQKLNDIVQNTV